MWTHLRRASASFFVDAWRCVAYCVEMATNLAIDESLLAEAKRLGQFPSKKETVNSALREFIERRKQKEIVKLFGTIGYDSDYDYKRLRDRKPKKR